MIRLFSYAFWQDRGEEIVRKFFAKEDIVFTEEERSILKNELWLVAVEISWEEELLTIWRTFKNTWTLICPHTANAIAWLEKYRNNSQDTDTQALISATASPWKFLAATAAWLSFESWEDISKLYKQYTTLEKSKAWVQKLLWIIKEKYNEFGKEFSMDLLPENLKDIYENWYEEREIVSPEDFGTKTEEFLREKMAKEFRLQVEDILNQK